MWVGTFVCMFVCWFGMFVCVDGYVCGGVRGCVLGDVYVGVFMCGCRGGVCACTHE